MNTKRTQTGVVLVVGLVMLIIITLLAVSSIKMSNVNLRIVGNEQAVKAMEAAAQQAIEVAIHKTNFLAHPTPTTETISVNPSTTNSASVSVSIPECLGSVKDEGSSLGLGTLPGAPQSLYWDIRATVTDATTGAAVEIHQGIRTPSVSGC